MKVTREMVSGLAATVLAQRYDNPKPTPSFHEELWALCTSDHKKVAIAAPRGHAKTTAITGSYLISTLVMRERKYALVLSDTEDQASEFLNELKIEFRENELLMEMYGVDKIVRDSATDMIVRFKDSHACRVIARGAEQKIRGKKWRGTRPDIIIVDDLENEELVSSDNRRSKLKRWFYGSVLPAGSDECVFRVVGTILHFDSLLENLMPKDDAIRTPLKDYLYGDWISVRFKAHPDEDDFSTLLWPEKFSEERLRSIRSDYLKQGIPEVYGQEYLNQPISKETAYFREQDLTPLEADDWDSNLTWYASADLAISQRDRAAYTVMFAAAMDENRRLQVRDRRKGRWDSATILDEIFSLIKRYNIQDFFLETENIARAIGPQIYERMRKESTYFTLHSVVPSKDKEARASPLQAMTRAGGVRFNTEAEWFPDLKRNMLMFPRGPFKDDVDALGLMAHGVTKLANPASDEEIAEEEYRANVWNMGFGRNHITGY